MEVGTTGADGLVTTKNSHQYHRIDGDPPNPCVEHEEHEPSKTDTQQQGGDIHLSHPGSLTLNQDQFP
jgi:hypothetical protein